MIVTIPCYPSVTAFVNDQNRIKKLRGNNMKSQKEMNHFIGWKFGVPVRILNIRSVQIDDFMYLIDETKSYFTAMSRAGNAEVFSKSNRSYELIPHTVCGAFNPRYPVCQNSKRTAYCNSNIGEQQMTQIDSNSTSDIKLYPTATLNIDGKIIELSAETTAELKKKLEI